MLRLCISSWQGTIFGLSGCVVGAAYGEGEGGGGGQFLVYIDKGKSRPAKIIGTESLDEQTHSDANIAVLLPRPVFPRQAS